jgi:hypothetical protein
VWNYLNEENSLLDRGLTPKRVQEKEGIEGLGNNSRLEEEMRAMRWRMATQAELV